MFFWLNAPILGILSKHYCTEYGYKYESTEKKKKGVFQSLLMLKSMELLCAQQVQEEERCWERERWRRVSRCGKEDVTDRLHLKDYFFLHLIPW